MKFDPLPITRASEIVEMQIKQAITDGKLKPGDKLPTEKQMAQQFGISLVTLKKVLEHCKFLD